MSESFDYIDFENFDYARPVSSEAIRHDAVEILAAIPKFLEKSEAIDQAKRTHGLDADVSLVHYAYQHENLPSARLRFVHRFARISEKYHGVNVEEMYCYIPEAFTASKNDNIDIDSTQSPEAILTVLAMEDASQAKFIITAYNCIAYDTFDDLNLDFSKDDNGNSFITATNTKTPQDEDIQHGNIVAHHNIFNALRLGNQSRNDGTAA